MTIKQLDRMVDAVMQSDYKHLSPAQLEQAIRALFFTALGGN